MIRSTALSRATLARTGLAVTALAAAVTLAACSSGSSDAPAASASAAASAPAASASASMAGTSPGTWTPLSVTTADEGKTIDMVPEQVALVNLDTTPGKDLYVTSSDEAIAHVEQAEGDDSDAVSAVPAVIAVAPGDATITVTEIDDSKDQVPPTVLTFTVHVTAAQ